MILTPGEVFLLSLIDVLAYGRAVSDPSRDAPSSFRIVWANAGENFLSRGLL